jgi:glycosyltransferase involved in cell wall biosynthesis
MKDKPIFSILIPTWNNLDYLKLCVESIKRHTIIKYQIIIHINDGSDGSMSWANEMGITCSYSPENIGVCKALNQCALKADGDYIVYFNDDMVALPGWDTYLMHEIERLGDDLFFFSSTMIEPFHKSSRCVIPNKDYGREADDFNETALLLDYQSFQFKNWNGASWPPNVVSKRCWDTVGGYSEEFSPGLYSDPDFSMKLWKIGVRNFKGVAASRVYHFGSKSLHRIEKNDGRRQFIEKWGITPGFFYRDYLKMGQPYRGLLKGPNKVKLMLNRLRCKLS